MDDASEGHITPRKLLADLDSFVAAGRRAELLDAFAKAVEPLYSLIIAAGGRQCEDGERAFAIFHLLARSITDLIAAVHLASHAYLQQAYTVLRPVHENCDLIELFAQSPSEAAEWVNAKKPGIKYSPAKVRARIAEPDVSKDVYGHLSEMGSHPRFAGSRITGAMRVRVGDPSVRQISLRMGSSYELHPASILVYTWIFEAVIRLGFKVRHLELVSDRVSRDHWVSTYLDCVQAASRGYKLIRQELLAMNAGDATEFMDTVYDDLITSLEPGGVLATLGDDAATPEDHPVL